MEQLWRWWDEKRAVGLAIRMLRRVAMSRNWPGYRAWVSTPCNSLSTAIPNSQGETDETTPPDFMQWAVQAEGMLDGRKLVQKVEKILT